MNEDNEKPETGRPGRQSRTGTTSTGARKASAKSTRSRAREFALQALYQYLVGGNDAASIDAFTRDLAGFHKADSVHYDSLLHGCVKEAAELDALILPLLDRKMEEISPIERGIMWIGAYEFPLFARMRDAARPHAELLAVSPAERLDVTYGPDADLEMAAVQYVSGGLFTRFGLRPAAGRLFTQADDRTPGAHPVALNDQ